ncbi:MAG TPA: PhoU domain-containing protein [Spirochaetota bacterium]|nr:PhoU domain-containing protein [Spirochaetota bacterium]
MGQSTVTSINLILEYIDKKNKTSINLISNIENDLDNDHIVVDKLCYDLVKKYKLTNEQARHIFAYMRCSSFLERIGDLSVKTINHLNRVLEFESDFDGKSELTLLVRFIKNLINKSIISLVNKNEEMANETIRDERENFKLKKNIIERCEVIMKEKSGYVPLSLEVIYSANSVENIGRLCKQIAENAIYIVMKNDSKYFED